VEELRVEEVRTRLELRRCENVPCAARGANREAGLLFNQD
jgi:hypothetical protein